MVYRDGKVRESMIAYYIEEGHGYLKDDKEFIITLQSEKIWRW